MVISSDTQSIGSLYDGYPETRSSRMNETGSVPKNGPGASPEETAVPKKKEKTGGKVELSDEEKKMIKELKVRDNEVRTHEMAHVAAGGQYVRGAASYSYQTGPDGMRYAIGGEVSIDTSSEKDADATIAKMRIVERAALAPADPSPEDRQVAAEAEKKIMAAMQEKSQNSAGESKPAGSPAASAYSKKGSPANTGKTSGSIVNIVL